eukprot:Nitzschia sp. Nitz4//scaffold23_size168460//114408//117133//NITZ4_002234-RA/size168460-snap-gene-0.165-mRNA-1//-1//CDS//3329543680//144//frame0
MKFSAAAFFLFIASTVSADAPPPFFLIDNTDQLCLGGSEFKRCSIETLWYVQGEPGQYQIHKRPATSPADATEDGDCIALDSSADQSQLLDAKLAKCSYSGAQNWNILGDAETGYVIAQGDGTTCLLREPGTNKAKTAPCDSTDYKYTALQLQFASPTDLETMQSGGARLVGAATDGDLAAIKAILADGVDVNAVDWDGLTALIPAASAGHLEICQFLVSSGVDILAKDKDGISALMEASIMGHADVVSYLLERGAEVDDASSSGVTALWLAASDGRVDVMKVLLAAGADASVSRMDGISALMIASVGGHTDAVAMLLESGADPKTADQTGLTPLMNAAENGSVEVMKLLVEQAEDESYVNLMSSSGFSAVIVAAAHGHVDAIKYLVEAGCDVNAGHENKVTALMYAAASGHVDAMKALIQEGKADLELKHTNGGTALLEACTAGKVDAVKLLVESGASFDFTDADGVTPLMAAASVGSVETQTFLLEQLKAKMSADQLTTHVNLFSNSGGSAVMFAAAGGHVECAKALLDLGADIKAVAQAKPGYAEKLQQMIETGQVVEEEPHVDGVTALHVAAQGGYLEMVQLLLAAGADVSIKDAADRTPLVMAIAGNHEEVAKALVVAGSDPNTTFVDGTGVEHNLLFDSIAVENEEFALMLIEKGADIKFRDESKVSCLLQAGHRGMTSVVKALLEKNGGKDGFVDTASAEGVTPLIAAASEGQLESLKLLIAAKADVNAKDTDGTTALMASSARGHLEVVKALLAAGASVNAQNSDGHTPLMFAYNGKNQVETLWERYNKFVAEGEGELDSDTMKILKEALDMHKSLVELLLKSGADASIKDKEGYQAKDFDFQPDADADILDKQAKAQKAKDESKNEL